MKIWVFSLALALIGLATKASPEPVEALRIDIWTLDCAQTQEATVRAALQGAARVFKPCGIRIEPGRWESLSVPEACSLPLLESERAPILASLVARPRKLNPHGLSLFIMPLEERAGGDTRYSFSLVEKSRQVLCGDPEPRFLTRFGSMFMTDFAFNSQDPNFTALLLAHEITHELTQRRHPTHAPRGTILVDHLTDIGPRITPADCACMRLSPYVKP